MPDHPRGPGGRRGVLIVLLAVVLGWQVIAAASASAHAELVSTTPGNGQQLDRPPAEVLLRFTERVTLVPDGVRLLDNAGHTASRAEAQTLPEDPLVVRLALPAALRDGGYVVSWRVVSADSHPVSGAFSFSVGNVVTPPVSAAGPNGSARVTSVVFWAIRWLAFAGLAVLVGGGFFLAVCWPGGRADRGTRRLLRAGWLASLGAAVAALAVQGPYTDGVTLVHVLDPALLRVTLGTDFGAFMVARLVLLAAAGMLLLRAHRTPGRYEPAAGAAVAVGLAATWSGTGHAHTGTHVGLAALSDTAHLLAMAVWLGGLAVVVSRLLPRARAAVRDADPAGAEMEADAEADVATALPRFSRIAIFAVLVLAGTGTFQAWRELPRPGTLATSAYGETLTLKLAAVALLLGYGAASRAVVRRRYARPAVEAARDELVTVPASAAPAASTGAAGDDAAAGDEVMAADGGTAGAGRSELSRLSATVGLETLVAAGVLALTAVLVAAAPPGHGTGAAAGHGHEETAAPPAGPNSVARRLPMPGGYVLTWVNPGAAGDNQVVVVVTDRTGAARKVPEVTAQLSLPGTSIARLPVPLTQTAPGQYSARRVILLQPGTWRLTLHVRTTEIDQTDLTADLPVRPQPLSSAAPATSSAGRGGGIRGGAQEGAE